MITLSRKMTLSVGLGLILVTNAVALVGVAYNRSAEPDSTLRLTERELQMPYWSWLEGENSGVGLRLQYRVEETDRPDQASSYSYYSSDAPSWLNKEKLAGLGFDVSRPVDTQEGRRYYDKMLEKEVLLVMEHDGGAYTAAVMRAQRRVERDTQLVARNPGAKEFENRRQEAQRNLDSERRSRSRLFIVDAGLDFEALRTRYPDRARYVIASGLIKPSPGSLNSPLLTGRIAGLNIDTIQMPHTYRKVFEPLLGSDRHYRNDTDPRYEVTISYGRRLEPWVVSASELNR